MIDELEAINEQNLSIDATREAVLELTKSHKLGCNGLSTWLSYFDGVIGDVIQDIYFEHHFNTMKSRLHDEANYEALIGAMGNHIYSMFSKSDGSVDIAKRVFGDKIFSDLEESMLTETKGIMRSAVKWKGEDWIDQKGLISSYRSMYADETKDSRYHSRIMEAFEFIVIEIESE